MRTERLIRFLLGILAAGVGVLLLNWLLRLRNVHRVSTVIRSEWEGGSERDFNPQRIRRLPQSLRNYCAFAAPQSGQEGILNSSKLRLRGVFLVHRHGDRSPILSIPKRGGAETACGLREPSEWEDWTSLKEALDNPQSPLSSRLHIPTSLRSFPLLPHPPLCIEGQLTAFGAVQLFRVGRYFHSAYRDFLDNGSGELETSLWTSPYTRTFHSALAFLAGLNMSREHSLQRSPTTHFCRGKSCQCLRLNSLRKSFESIRHQRFLQSRSTKLKEAVHNLGNVILGQDALNDPLSLFDTLMGAFACRGLDLPCVEGNCALPTHLDTFLKFHTDRMRGLNGERGGVLGKLAAAESVPILRDVVSAGRLIQGELNSPRRFFRYFSGHDVTLRPLLISLRLYSGLIPHYAARLVFELYQSLASGDVLIRVLYNGKDMTSDVSWCEAELSRVDGVSLCPLRAFKAFLRDELFQAQGAEDLKHLCSQPL